MYVNQFAAFFAGFFGTNTDEMAFYGRFEGSHFACIAVEHIVKAVDKTLVAAAVCVALFGKLVDIDDFRVFLVTSNGDFAFLFVHRDLPHRAVESNSSAAAVGEARHGKGCLYAVFKCHHRLLVVYYVVIASEYAASVRAFFHCFHELFFGERSGRDDVEGPKVNGTAFLFPKGEIDVLCAVRTILFNGAIHTAFCRACRRVLRVEEGAIADGRNALAFRVCIILQYLPNLRIHAYYYLS